jgi:hypothetical protein
MSHPNYNYQTPYPNPPQQPPQQPGQFIQPGQPLPHTYNDRPGQQGILSPFFFFEKLMG